MSSEDSDSDHSPCHLEFDPEVKWAEINQVNPTTPKHLMDD